MNPQGCGPLDPKSSAFANFATLAVRLMIFSGKNNVLGSHIVDSKVSTSGIPCQGDLSDKLPRECLSTKDLPIGQNGGRIYADVDIPVMIAFASVGKLPAEVFSQWIQFGAKHSYDGLPLERTPST